MTASPIASASTYPDFQLHSLGWKAFQDLCLTVLSDQLGQAVQRYSTSNDGGRDGAFVGEWNPTNALSLTGETVVQCKYTNRRDATLTISEFQDEFAKAKNLWQRRHRDNYIVLTNYRVTAEFEEAARCSDLITSAALLDYIAPFRLELRENRGTLLLTFTENMLGLTDNNLITSDSAGIMRS
jgi:hypothetical protein